MSERKVFCNFSIETPIYDVDLPSKIKEKLDSLDLRPDPKKVYDLDVSFSVDTYYELEFYHFPVEWKQHEIDMLEKIKNRPNERRRTITHGVLGQQIHKICDALKPFNINLSSARIAGEREIEDVDRVYVSIFEDPTKKREKRALTCSLIIPDRIGTLITINETLEKLLKDQEKEKQKKAQEKAQHTPDIKSIEEIFLALATAILEDCPDKSTTPKRLSREMILQGKIENDWPLEIRGHFKYDAKEKRVMDMPEMDCPEFLVYEKSKAYWTLSKAKDLEEAEKMVLNRGYKYKDVEQVIVLHNLKNLKFELYSRSSNDNRIKPISKSNAHTAKKLSLSWVDFSDDL